MKKNSAQNSAFSLIELSVVLIIISVLVAGVMQSTSLVNLARLMNARSYTSKSPVPSIGGLVAWYETSSKNSFKAVDNAADNSEISDWYDINPASLPEKKNTLVANSVIYKTDGINKIPSLQFTSANANLDSFFQGTSAQYTIFLVFRPTSTSGTILDSDTSGATNSISIAANALNLNAGSSADIANTFIASTNYITAVYFNRAVSEAYVNDAVNIAGSAINSGTNQLDGLTIGSNKSGTNNFSGLISEVIIFNRPLKFQERKDVMSYLSKKYSITVAGL